MLQQEPICEPPATVTNVVRFEIMVRDRFRCVYCGRGASEDAVLQIDHFTPRSAGGDNHVSNLVTSCKDCNTAKANRLLPMDAHEITAPMTSSLAELLNLRRRAKSDPVVSEPCDGFDKTAYQREYMRKRRAGEAKTVRVSIETDIVDAFKATGPGWQARINAALRAVKPA